jgi:preprotein translocase subunit YajC
MQVDTTSVLLQVDTNVKIRIEKSSIGSVQNAKADKE